VVLSGVTPCGLLGDYQHFGKKCTTSPSSSNREDGGDTFLATSVTMYKTTQHHNQYAHNQQSTLHFLLVIKL
jgi:hypothetical protein